MPPKGPTIWENPVFLNNLVVSLYEAANQASGLSPVVKDAIVESLHQQEHDISWEAIRQHVQKLRKNRDVSGINKAASGAATPTKTTPAKPASARKRKTPSKKSAKELTPVDDEEEVKNLKRELSDEELEVTTPTKKAKINEQLRKLCKEADAAEANEV